MSHKALSAESRSLLGRIEKKSRQLYHKREATLRKYNKRLRKDVKRLGA